MRFSVVACPSCRRIQPIETRHHRVACRGCRHALEPASLKTFYRGDDETEARTVTLRLTAKREGMPIEDYARLLETIQRENAGTVDDVLLALTAKEEFALADFQDEMRRRFVPGDPERVLQQLTLANRLYEPRMGRYRFV